MSNEKQENNVFYKNLTAETFPEIDTSKRTIFTDCNFNDMDFKDIPVKNFLFIDCKLDNTDFTHCNLDDCGFMDCSLKNAKLNNVIMNNARVSNCDMTKASISNGNLSNLTIDNTNLHDANLNKTILKNSNFKNVNFKNTNLSLADLENSNIGDYYTTMDFYEANLDQTNLKRCRFSGDINFKSAVLTQTNWNYATTSASCNMNFDHANLSEADLSDWHIETFYITSNKSMKGANFAKCKMTGVEFDQFDFSYSTFQDVDLSQTKFRNCKLNNIILVHCTFGKEDSFIFKQEAPPPKMILYNNVGTIKQTPINPVPLNEFLKETIFKFHFIKNLIGKDVTQPIISLLVDTNLIKYIYMQRQNAYPQIGDGRSGDPQKSKVNTFNQMMPIDPNLSPADQLRIINESYKNIIQNMKSDGKPLYTHTFFSMSGYTDTQLEHIKLLKSSYLSIAIKNKESPEVQEQVYSDIKSDKSLVNFYPVANVGGTKTVKELKENFPITQTPGPSVK